MKRFICLLIPLALVACTLLYMVLPCAAADIMDLKVLFNRALTAEGAENQELEKEIMAALEEDPGLFHQTLASMSSVNRQYLESVVKIIKKGMEGVTDTEISVNVLNLMDRSLKDIALEVLMDLIWATLPNEAVVDINYVSALRSAYANCRSAFWHESLRDYLQWAEEALQSAKTADGSALPVVWSVLALSAGAAFTLPRKRKISE